VGRPAADNRRFLNAVLWILRTRGTMAGPAPRLRAMGSIPIAASAGGAIGAWGPPCGRQ